MAFQLKNFTSISAAVINRMRSTQSAITDFNIGSVVRTIIEAVSAEIDQFYQQMFNGLKEAIPVATYSSFNFPPLPPNAASGLFTITITSSASSTTIPAGTVFQSALATTPYVSTVDVVIPPATTTGTVYAVAATPGILGNLPAATAMTATPAITGLVSIANAIAFQNGSDLETADQQKQRFGNFIQSIAKGTIPALIYGAKTVVLYDVNGAETERVQAAAVVEPWVSDGSQPISLVNLYIHNGVGSTSDALVTQTGKVILGYVDDNGVKVPGYKAAGVKCVTAKATEVTVAVTAALTAAPGYTHAALVGLAEVALSTYILGLDIGEKFIFMDAIALVAAIPGVSNFVFSTPTADVTPTASQKLMPGVFTIP